MRKYFLLLASMALVLALPSARADSVVQSAQVMVVGTWHFSNPGQDINNMESDDMLSVKRQQELHAVAQGLEKFKPNVVAVEWPTDTADAAYAAYRKRELPVDALRNEVVQLGFRIAMHSKLKRVYGIDMPGEFPMDKVAAWASAHGKGEDFGALMGRAQAMVGAESAMLKTRSIAEVLHHLNEPRRLALGQELYLELLRYGSGAEQPGAELNAAWQRRNLMICARLLQSIEPGDRAIVFFGQGHAQHLRDCIDEAPGVDLVEVNSYLPE